MANRVTITVSTRDLTRPQIQRMRRQFNDLGNDINRAIGRRTRQNFARLSQSANQARRDLQALRGAIPEADFIRLDNAIQSARRRLDRGFGNVGNRAFQRIINDLRTVQQGFNDLDRSGRIRVRVDLAALRRADAQLAAWRRRQGGDDVRVRVRPEVDGNIFSRTLRRALASPLQSLGDTFSDGFGQAIARGLYAAANNPYVAAAVLALVAAITSLLGAALAGTLTFVFGGAIVGLGGFIAAQSKRVKDAFSKELEELKPLFQEAAEPMIPVLEHGIELMGEMGRKFAPAFQEALEEAAPYLTDFMDHLAKGMEDFGKIAGEPMMEGFNQLLTELGPQLESWFRSLGESFAHLGQVVAENREEIALAMRIILELVPLAIDLVAWLAQQWSNMVRNIEAVTGQVQNLWGWVSRQWDMLIEVAAPNVVPITNRIMTLWGWVNRNWTRLVRFSAPGLAQVTGRVTSLWGWVNRNWTRFVRFSAPGIAGVLGRIQDLWNWVNRNWFKSIRFDVSVTGAVDLARRIAGLATGGVAGVGRRIGTAATGGVRSNATLVGEQGPEIVELPTGSRVRSNPDTKRLLGGSRDGGPVVIRIEAGNSDLDRMLLKILRHAIRVEGGNVQYVLGTGE